MVVSDTVLWKKGSNVFSLLGKFTVVIVCHSQNNSGLVSKKSGMTPDTPTHSSLYGEHFYKRNLQGYSNFVLNACTNLPMLYSLH